uniref:Uncharacterized protein n=1 Tax=Panagrolaimus davidi TaxID=227884 RepID=A0A914PFN8_9BILA
MTYAVVIASWGTPSSSSSDYPNSVTGPFAQDTGTDESYAKGTQQLADFIIAHQGGGRSSGTSSNYYGNYNYNNYYVNRSPQPIHGYAGYTYGQINNLGNIRGQQNLNYNEYSYHYWRCINYYRGQYYYSYTFNGYVCDTRANRQG